MRFRCSLCGVRLDREFVTLRLERYPGGSSTDEKGVGIQCNRDTQGSLTRHKVVLLRIRTDWVYHDFEHGCMRAYYAVRLVKLGA